MRSIISKVLVAALAISAAACSTQQPADPDAAPEADPADTAPVPDDAVFTETGVFIDADGSIRTVERQITAGEERAQNAARERWIATGRSELLIQDTACQGFSAWLFQRADFVGNKICFNGSGYADLSKFKRYVCGPIGCYATDWRLSSGSVWGGNEEGRLEEAGIPYPVDGGTSFIHFNAYEKVSFDVSPAHINFLVLGVQ